MTAGSETFFDTRGAVQVPRGSETFFDQRVDLPPFVGNKARVKQIDVTEPLPMFVTTVAGLPNPVGLASHIAYVTDEVGGATPVFSDGGVWRRWADRNPVA